MSEDESRPLPAAESDASERRRSWFERLGAAFSGEPTTRGDVLEFLRDAEADGLLDYRP